MPSLEIGISDECYYFDFEMKTLGGQLSSCGDIMLSLPPEHAAASGSYIIHSAKVT